MPLTQKPIHSKKAGVGRTADPPDKRAFITILLYLFVGIFSLGALLLALLATAFLVEGWAVKGDVEQKKTVEAEAQPQQTSKWELTRPNFTLKSELTTYHSQPAAVTPSSVTIKEEAQIPGWTLWLRQSVLKCRQYTRWLSHDLGSAEEVEWGDTAGALGGAAGVFATLATVLLAYIQVLEQLSRTDEQLRLSRDERRQADHQLELLGNQARVGALTAQLNTTRARVETLWKGSQLDFDRQVLVGDGLGTSRNGQEEERELERIIAQITAEIDKDDPHYEIVTRAVHHWYRTSSDLDRAVEDWKSCARAHPGHTPEAAAS